MKQTDFDPVLKLSPRELQVFTMSGEGMTTKEILHKLKLNRKTVESHFAHIREKTGLRDLVAIRFLAVRYVVFCEQNKLKLAPTPVARAPKLSFQRA
jgi:DNA-binding CsgD family transcriptional regulator